MRTHRNIVMATFALAARRACDSGQFARDVNARWPIPGARFPLLNFLQKLGLDWIVTIGCAPYMWLRQRAHRHGNYACEDVLGSRWLRCRMSMPARTHTRVLPSNLVCRARPRPCTIGKIRRRSKNKILRLMLTKKDFQNNCHYESIADLFIIITTTSSN